MDARKVLAEIGAIKLVVSVLAAGQSDKIQAGISEALDVLIRAGGAGQPYSAELAEAASAMKDRIQGAREALAAGAN